MLSRTSCSTGLSLPHGPDGALPPLLGIGGYSREGGRVSMALPMIKGAGDG